MQGIFMTEIIKVDIKGSPEDGEHQLLEISQSVSRNDGGPYAWGTFAPPQLPLEKWSKLQNAGLLSWHEDRPRQSSASYTDEDIRRCGELHLILQSDLLQIHYL
eukprot:gene22222-biopygen7861